MVIVYCGPLWYGGTCRMRMEALQSQGHTLVGIDSSCRPLSLRGLAARALWKAGRAADTVGVNRALRRAVRHKPDAVWIDKGLTLRSDTLAYIRESLPAVQLVHYSPDDMGGRHNQSGRYLECVPLYDLHVTTKSFNIPELYALGARQALLLNNAYCPVIHRPVPLSPPERERLGAPVGFIGAFETDRAEAIWFLAENGIRVRVWGGGWGRWASKHRHSNLTVEDRYIWGDEYARAICAFDINLGFLRKLNRDLQTTRSVEIPACGGFLLAERTQEHLRLFEEGVEAEFFASSEELLDKCRYYLAHPDERREIATAGRQRCIRSDYSYERQVGMVLERLQELREEAHGVDGLAGYASAQAP